MKRISVTKKSVWIVVLIILLTVILSESASYFVLLEFKNRGLWLDEHYHPFLGWTPPKNATIRLGGHCGYGNLLTYGYIKTDTHGRSITPLAFDKPELKIAVTGGGPVMGAGSSSNETTFPSVLEKIIHEKTGIKVEVYNLGVGGYNSFQEMLALYEFLKQNKVDLVVSISGRGDASDALQEQDIRSASLIAGVYDKADIINKGASLSFFLRSYSKTYNLIHGVWPKAWRKLKDILANNNDGWFTLAKKDNDRDGRVFDNIEKRSELTSLHYSTMNALAKENEAMYIMMLMPTAFTKKNLTEAEAKCSDSRVYMDVRVTNDLLREYEQKFYNQFRKIPKEYRFYDLTDIFDQIDATALVDMCHYNDIGASVLADAVFEKIKPFLLQSKHNQALEIESK